MSPNDLSGALAFVAQSRLLENVPPEVVARTLAHVELLEFTPGAHVIVEASPKMSAEDSGLYVLVAGQLLASRALRDGRTERLSTIGPGEFFGELARADDGLRSATVTAMTPSVVARIPGPTTARLIAEAPIVMRTIAASIARRLRAADEARLEARLNEERLSSIGRAAAMLVHDLRNPLGVVKNASECIERGVGEPEKMAQASRKAAAFMLAMVQDLLDFAKGDRVYARDAFNLRDIVDEIEAFGLGPLEAAGVVTVTRRLFANAELIGDQRALIRALLNIIKNAGEAMPAGGTLSILTETSNGTLRIVVSDTGPGIPDHILVGLFEPFSSHGKAGGTGLGMAMTKAAIDGHGGTISVSTREGEGTTFTVVLPLRT